MQSDVLNYEVVLRGGMFMVCSAALLACSPAMAPSAAPPTASRELLEADRAFSRLSVERGAGEAFSTWLADDAIELPNGEEPLVGRVRIAKSMADDVPAATHTLRWAPERAEIAASGDLGWTWGRYTLEVRSKGGQARTATGKYVSIWRREKGAPWRVVLDMGNAAPK